MTQSVALKLYVFRDFCPDYAGGLAFAIARDQAHAREQIEVHNLDTPVARCVAGGN